MLYNSHLSILRHTDVSTVLETSLCKWDARGEGGGVGGGGCVADEEKDSDRGHKKTFLCLR